MPRHERADFPIVRSGVAGARREPPPPSVRVTTVSSPGSNSTRYAHYKATIEKELADPSAYIRPLSRAGGN
jgi:hypothetical protein